MFCIMILNNLNFATWCKNHDDEHNAKWCREVYPWVVFSKIDFAQDKIGTIQTVLFNKINYNIKVIDIKQQNNGRFIATFELITIPKFNKMKWEERTWNTCFQMVYTPNGDFITVFTKKEDPSKELVSKFMKGNFLKVEEYRSIPVSELLFKSLISYIAKEEFTELLYYKEYAYIPEGYRTLPEHNQFKARQKAFYPLYSLGRERWISYCFNEEKAHRMALSIANQCNYLIVIYCNPIYTRHHRCTYPNTEVLSLYEFCNRISPKTRKKYEKQIKLLQNHLNIPTEQSIASIIKEINNPAKDFYPIEKPDLMESYGIMKMEISNLYDAFYYFAAMNLINAWLSRKNKIANASKKEAKLFKDMYYFKTYIQSTITDLINNNKQIEDINIYIEKNLVMIDLLGFVFSFHNIPLNEAIIQYSLSNKNKTIEWTGKRLQPIAPLLLAYARLISHENVNLTEFSKK